MKLIKEEFQDRFGKYPLRFTGVISLRELHEYLYDNFNGYKFAILFDEIGGEFEDYGKEIRVYFLDDIADEAATYAGKKLIDDDRLARKWNKDENGFYSCSKCRFKFNQPEYKTPYCPNCGEKMANGIDLEKLQELIT